MTEAVVVVNDYWFDVLGFRYRVCQRPLRMRRHDAFPKKQICDLLLPLKATMFRVDFRHKSGKLQQRIGVQRERSLILSGAPYTDVQQST
jgi:hypothetical protein